MLAFRKSFVDFCFAFFVLFYSTSTCACVGFADFLSKQENSPENAKAIIKTLIDTPSNALYLTKHVMVENVHVYYPESESQNKAGIFFVLTRENGTIQEIRSFAESFNNLYCVCDYVTVKAKLENNIVHKTFANLGGGDNMQKSVKIAGDIENWINWGNTISQIMKEYSQNVDTKWNAARRFLELSEFMKIKLLSDIKDKYTKNPWFEDVIIIQKNTGVQQQYERHAINIAALLNTQKVNDSMKQIVNWKYSTVEDRDKIEIVLNALTFFYNNVKKDTLLWFTTSEETEEKKWTTFLTSFSEDDKKSGDKKAKNPNLLAEILNCFCYSATNGKFTTLRNEIHEKLVKTDWYSTLQPTDYTKFPLQKDIQDLLTTKKQTEFDTEYTKIKDAILNFWNYIQDSKNDATTTLKPADYIINTYFTPCVKTAINKLITLPDEDVSVDMTGVYSVTGAGDPLTVTDGSIGCEIRFTVRHKNSFVKDVYVDIPEGMTNHANECVRTETILVPLNQKYTAIVSVDTLPSNSIEIGSAARKVYAKNATTDEPEEKDIKKINFSLFYKNGDGMYLKRIIGSEKIYKLTNDGDAYIGSCYLEKAN